MSFESTYEALQKTRAAFLAKRHAVECAAKRGEVAASATCATGES